MWQIGVWEQNEGLAEGIAALTDDRSALVRACSHPALLAGIDLDLLVVSPGAVGWAGAASLICRRALLPGGSAALIRALPGVDILTYGSSARSCITLSGFHEGRAAVAIQQEFSDLRGCGVERQELVLSFDGSTPTDLFLAQVGAALLLGRLPGRRE